MRPSQWLCCSRSDYLAREKKTHLQRQRRLAQRLLALDALRLQKVQRALAVVQLQREGVTALRRVGELLLETHRRVVALPQRALQAKRLLRGGLLLLATAEQLLLHRQVRRAHLTQLRRESRRFFLRPLKSLLRIGERGLGKRRRERIPGARAASRSSSSARSAASAAAEAGRRDPPAARPASDSSSSGEAAPSSCSRCRAPAATSTPEAGSGPAKESAVQLVKGYYWQSGLHRSAGIDVVCLAKTGESTDLGVLLL